MKTSIIDTKCSACRRPYRGRGEWDMLTLNGKLVGITCPRCVEMKTPSRNHSNGAIDSAAHEDTAAADLGVKGNFSSLVHLAGRKGRNLTLQIDQAEIWTKEQATELGQTLLLLGQLLIPTSSSSHELEEGPNLNAA